MKIDQLIAKKNKSGYPRMLPIMGIHEGRKAIVGVKRRTARSRKALQPNIMLAKPIPVREQQTTEQKAVDGVTTVVKAIFNAVKNPLRAFRTVKSMI